MLTDIGLITRDGFYMFVDLSETLRREHLKANKQYFFSGDVIEFTKGIPCLKVGCLTPAEGLDTGLYVNARMVMDYFLKGTKKSASGAQEDSTKNPSNGISAKVLGLENGNSGNTDTLPSLMQEEQLPQIVDVETQKKSDKRVVNIE